MYNVGKHELLHKNTGSSQTKYFVVTVVIAFVRPYKRLVHNLTETVLRTTSFDHVNGMECLCISKDILHTRRHVE